MYPEPRTLGRGQHPFDVPYARRKFSMLIEPAIYLNELIRDYLTAGGRLVIREFRSVQDVIALDEDLVFNCTGLGATTLFNDEELTPVRGQLVVLLPQPEVDYMTIGPSGIYMFPRRDGILLGGSFERGATSLDPDPSTTDRILRQNGELFVKMRA